MVKVRMSEEQKRVVRRYATSWQLWRKGDRSFASLEYDMAAGYEVLANGLATDPKARHGITADAGDPEYYAAIFGNDDAAVPDEGHVRSGLGKAMDAVREVVNKE